MNGVTSVVGFPVYLSSQRHHRQHRSRQGDMFRLTVGIKCLLLANNPSPQSFVGSTNNTKVFARKVKAPCLRY